MTADAALPWLGVRVARPVRDLARAGSFYGDLLGLPRTGGFTGHDGYDGAFFALPGGAELELTTSPTGPAAGTEEDLLVLYVSSAARVNDAAARLWAAGVRRIPAANPYWERWGATFLDPDGYRVVVAVADGGAGAQGATRADGAAGAGDLRVALHDGPREALRRSFELAEDSRAQLDSYLATGRVLVATGGAGALVGHLQLVATGTPGEAEVKNMAVREDNQGRGVGRLLVQAAVDLLAAESVTRLLVTTAAASTGNLRFYQRLGFRLHSVERDAFTPATGYPPGMQIDGIELRDLVRLDRPISAASAAPAASGRGTPSPPR